MNYEMVASLLEHSIDRLAAVEHERWAHWQRYMHEKGTRLDDGSLVLPAELIERWDEQIAKPFHALSPEEQESDREQVRRYVPLMAELLSASVE